MSEIVWVIDDCPMSTKIAKARLRTLGADVYTLPSGNAAVSAWINDALPRPTAMLLDMNMPGVDGLQAGRLLRDAGFTGLLLLHTNSNGVKAASGEIGPSFDGVMLKPSSADDMGHMLAEAAAKRRSRAA